MDHRQTALRAALDLHVELGVAQTVAEAEGAILSTATRFAAWLDGTARLRLIVGPVIDETTGTTLDIEQGDSNMQINTGQKFDVVCDTEDAAGYDTPETIAWTIDNPDVAALTVSEDTHTCTVTSGAPGSAVLTATVTSLDPPLSATLAVDVVPAGTATIELVPGEAVDE